jgi:hypothetical protein
MSKARAQYVVVEVILPKVGLPTGHALAAGQVTRADEFRRFGAPSPAERPYNPLDVYGYQFASVSRSVRTALSPR